MDKVVVVVFLVHYTLGVYSSGTLDSYSAPSQLSQSPSSFGGGSSPPGGFSTPRHPSSSYGAPSRVQLRRPSNTYGSPEGDKFEPARYQFQYNVEAPGDGQASVRFGHQESRDGEVTQGSYYVLLPDGRVQNVVYTADRRGYHPTVSYQGGGGRGSRLGGY